MKLLSIDDLSVTLGTKIILDKVNLEVNSGEIVGIIGPSGIGKSVLLKTILGIYRKRSIRAKNFYFYSKNKKYDLLRIKHKDVRIIRKEMQYIFQNPLTALPQNRTIKSLLLETMKNFKIFEDISKEDIIEKRLKYIEELFGLFFDYKDEKNKSKNGDINLKIDINSKIGLLSQGQQQRVAIMRAIVVQPTLLMADEITSSLDSVNKLIILHKLLKYKYDVNENQSIMIISHDHNIINNVSDLTSIYEMRKVNGGNYATLFRI